MNEIKTHELKLKTDYFSDVRSGKKNFEIRENDRNFNAGDKLIMHAFGKPEYDMSGSACNRQNNSYVKWVDVTTPELRIGWQETQKDWSDTVSVAIESITDKKTWETSINSDCGVGYPVGVDYREVIKVLESYFGSTQLPDGYVILKTKRGK